MLLLFATQINNISQAACCEKQNQVKPSLGIIPTEGRFAVDFILDRSFGIFNKSNAFFAVKRIDSSFEFPLDFPRCSRFKGFLQAGRAQSDFH